MSRTFFGPSDAAKKREAECLQAREDIFAFYRKHNPEKLKGATTSSQNIKPPASTSRPCSAAIREARPASARRDPVGKGLNW